MLNAHSKPELNESDVDSQVLSYSKLSATIFQTVVGYVFKHFMDNAIVARL